MISPNSRSLLIAAAGALACLLSPTSARAGQTFDTTPSWDGQTDIAGFGPYSAFDTPTYGQTFIAPVGNTYLNDFTFYVASTDFALGNFGYLPDAVGDVFKVQGQVFNWSGSLIGGSPTQGTVGAALYTSPTFTITSDGSFEAVTVSIPGGLGLIAGNSYVIDLTDITGPSSDLGVFGAATGYQHVANDGGGGFAYSNNPSPIGTWDDGGDFGDLAFKADFSSTGSRVPDAASTAVLLALGLAALAVLSLRQRLAARS